MMLMPTAAAVEQNIIIIIKWYSLVKLFNPID